MPSLPKLKTDAVTQYPATRSIRYEHAMVRFVDGAEQRYRNCSGPLHRWEIRLSQLDEAEIAAIEAFFCEAQGAFEDFAFTDPRDGTTYSSCSLLADGLQVTASGEINSATRLTIIENR